MSSADAGGSSSRLCSCTWSMPTSFDRGVVALSVVVKPTWNVLYGISVVASFLMSSSSIMVSLIEYFLDISSVLYPL